MLTTFDKETHIYRIGAEPVPSVTQVIGSFGLIDAHADSYCLDRGTYVHSATVMLEHGSLDEASLDPVLGPYVEAYKAFLASVKYKAILTEQDLYDDTLMFAGTPDRVCEINGRRSVLDIKTGGPAKWHPLQTAAYKHLSAANAYPAIDRYSLYLKPDGTFKLRQHKSPLDWPSFSALVSAHHVRKNYGGKDAE